MDSFQADGPMLLLLLPMLLPPLLLLLLLLVVLLSMLLLLSLPLSLPLPLLLLRMLLLAQQLNEGDRACARFSHFPCPSAHARVLARGGYRACSL